jgi:hypothetical protein
MNREAARAYVWELTDGWIDADAALRAEKVLTCLLDRNGVPVPTIAPGPDGLVGFTWRTERAYLSLELHASGAVEFFHEDLETGRFMSLDDVRDSLEQLDPYFASFR